MADGVLAAENFATLHRKTNESIAEVSARLVLCEADELDIDTALGYLASILWNTSAVWKTTDLLGKLTIQRRLFPDGLRWSNGSFGRPQTHSIYTLLASDTVDAGALVAPQGFEPRSSESESLVLPLNEGAINKVLTAAAGSAGATISRLCECTGDMLMGQPLAVHKPYSSRRISSGF